MGAWHAASKYMHMQQAKLCMLKHADARPNLQPHPLGSRSDSVTISVICRGTCRRLQYQRRSSFLRAVQERLSANTWFLCNARDCHTNSPRPSSPMSLLHSTTLALFQFPHKRLIALAHLQCPHKRQLSGSFWRRFRRPPKACLLTYSKTMQVERDCRKQQLAFQGLSRVRSMGSEDSSSK